MNRKLPPLSTLRLFDAAGRHVSFKRAAEELHVTPGAVSHGIAALEDWLGVKLFERGPRGLALSAAGRDYLPYVSEALELFATGTRRLPRGGQASVVLVSAAPTFAKHLLIPRLARFRERQPAATVNIDTRRRAVSFPVDGVDFAIRMGRGPAPGLRSTPLVAERLVPVASPSYWNGLPAGGLARRLAAATLIHVDPASEDWAAWIDRARPDGVDPRTAAAGAAAGAAALHVDTIQLAFDAAMAGLGVAIGRRPLVDGEIAAGRLVAVGPEVPAATGYWLISHPGAGRRAELAAFEDWVIGEMRALSVGAAADTAG